MLHLDKVNHLCHILKINIFFFSLKWLSYTANFIKINTVAMFKHLETGTAFYVELFERLSNFKIMTVMRMEEI